MSSENAFPLPAGLPVPEDDGAAAILLGARLPDVPLQATSGQRVNLGFLHGRWLVYVYPMTGRPGLALPTGWDQIPGARGCTPESCAFRDLHDEFKALDTGVFGLSSQTTEYQREAKERLHLPFELLSDPKLELENTLQLPTFEVDGMRLYKRLTFIFDGGSIRKVFYPIFPPDQHPREVLDWLREEG